LGVAPLKGRRRALRYNLFVPLYLMQYFYFLPNQKNGKAQKGFSLQSLTQKAVYKFAAVFLFCNTKLFFYEVYLPTYFVMCFFKRM
jgi:hypothetical protein